MELARKLALRGRRLRGLGAPTEFRPDGEGSAGAGEALLVFVPDRWALRRAAPQIVSSARADGLTGVAYPKAGQLGTDLNRDSLAEALAGEGIRPVTQIALDGTWSALRFRPSR
jgi:hypothetical protein